MTWRMFDEASGVLELDNPDLELHWLGVGGFTVAWWCDDLGRFLGFAEVGVG